MVHCTAVVTPASGGTVRHPQSKHFGDIAVDFLITKWSNSTRKSVGSKALEISLSSMYCIINFNKKKSNNIVVIGNLMFKITLLLSSRINFLIVFFVVLFYIQQEIVKNGSVD